MFESIRPAAAEAQEETVVSELVAIDRRIDAREGEAIEDRWEFGRKLLWEREKNGGKQLPHGLLPKLVQATGKSEREIQYRVQFAAEYDSEEKVRNALRTFRSWYGIVTSGLGEGGEKKAHVANNSGENEWYTPPEFIEAARLTMGQIDLDPASTAVANNIVKATTFYTKEDDGLSRPWRGRVWMNPPYAQPLVSHFCERLVDHYKGQKVPAACVLVNNATETTWFASVAEEASAICFPEKRVKFWHPERESAPLQGQSVLYLGADPLAFARNFRSFGHVWVKPW